MVSDTKNIRMKEGSVKSLANLACLSAVAIALVLSLVAVAQRQDSERHQDPLVGTWNENGVLNDGSLPFIAVMNFNAGGTTDEFDTNGTNSSGSPGVEGRDYHLADGSGTALLRPDASPSGTKL